MTALVRLTGRGARALWRFLVGDTPEFAAVVAGLVVYALALHHLHPAVVFGLPSLVVGALAVSVLHRRRSAARRPVPAEAPVTEVPTPPG